jgi:predicted transcriptional regulator
MGKALSKAQRELLAIISVGRPLSPPEIAKLTGKPISAISTTRNALLRLGLVNQWRHWNDMPTLTPAGRAALSEGEP